mmetsp:Transcript_2795/g.8437  ORF Transcript_2795/g.8437 Transcript_2795/m.8437 type:complete len:208 (-) Transcript_2795:418-1041(-)
MVRFSRASSAALTFIWHATGHGPLLLRRKQAAACAVRASATRAANPESRSSSSNALPRQHRCPSCWPAWRASLDLTPSLRFCAGRVRPLSCTSAGTFTHGACHLSWTGSWTPSRSVTTTMLIAARFLSLIESDASLRAASLTLSAVGEQLRGRRKEEERVCAMPQATGSSCRKSESNIDSGATPARSSRASASRRYTPVGASRCAAL